MPEYSAAKGDRGDVYLNGEKIDYVFTCNTDEGFVLVYDRDYHEHGFSIKVDENGDTVMKKMFGSVVFEPNNG